MSTTAPGKESGYDGNDVSKPTGYGRPTSKRQARPRTGRTQVGTVDVIAASVVVLRPVVVSVGIIVAAVTWATPGRADVGDSVATVLNTVGIGNNGPVSSVIAQIGQSICPLLVQPGSNFASSATQMSGNGGLASRSPVLSPARRSSRNARRS